MRQKLAYVETIKSKELMDGCDKIAYFSLTGNDWQVIAEIELEVNDKVIYIEYDTILKNYNEAFDFLKKRCWSEKYNGFLIKAMKMKGKTSYGLILPLNFLEKIGFKDDYKKFENGRDLTGVFCAESKPDDIEVTTKTYSKLDYFKYKYLYRFFPFLKPRKKELKWPLFIQKTDETRVENLSNLFWDNNFQGKDFEATLKMDGMSGTFANDGEYFYVCSRNQVRYKAKLSKAEKELNPLKIDKYDDVFLKMACKYNITRKIGIYHAIQGEVCGPTIQGNKMGLKEKVLMVFNLIDLKIQRYYSYNAISEFCDKQEIPIVPFVLKGKFSFKNKAELKEIANNVKYDTNKSCGEGIVIRFIDKEFPNLIEKPYRGMSNLASFKVISDVFALKYSK
jgi:hypothetical protein